MSIEVNDLNTGCMDKATGIPWPKIRLDGETPIALGVIVGSMPAFITVSNRQTVYLRKSIVADPKTARNIYEQLLPTINGSWQLTDRKWVRITVNQQPMTAELRAALCFIEILLHPEPK